MVLPALSSALCREARWTESVAVGSELFVHAHRQSWGSGGNGREVVGADGSYELREVPAAYPVNFGYESAGLRLQNGYVWDDPDEMSAS
jgi:hypothetical protein